MGKKIYDALHGFIHFTPLEQQVVESRPFQRLYNIHQLGVAFLVYPGGTNKRFEHSIGTMKIATDMYDQICDELPQGEDRHYWRQIVRMAALCHDIGHLPFSHTAESLVLPDGGHEQWTKKLINSEPLLSIWKEIGPKAAEHITKLAIGSSHHDGEFSPTEQTLTELITGDLFGADRIDYLLRDGRSTGLAYGLFDHTYLIENLQLDPDTGRIKMGREGTESVESLLLARYFMHKRLYEYPAVKGYNYHMARFIKKYFDQNNALSSPDLYLRYNDHNILSELTYSNDEDALRLTKQKPRYSAIKLDPNIDEKELTDWVKKAGIPEDSVTWDFTARRKGAFQLSFPQLEGSKSDLSVRFVSANWLFIDPQYEGQWDSKKHLTE